MKAAIYQSDTGEVIKVVTGPEDFCAAQCKTGQSWVDVGGESGTNHYVSNGALVSFPDQPSKSHVFNYATRQWVADSAIAWSTVRAQRDKLLAASDFTQLPDTPKDKHTWAVYRKALRDITTQSDPFNITWPVAPG